MKRIVIVSLLLVAATTAGAQVMWVGAGTGTSWEWQADTAPDTDFLHASDLAPSGFFALVIDEDTLLRFQVGDMQHDLRVGAADVPAKLRSYTVGVDYTMSGVLGTALFSAGLGAYEVRPKGEAHDDLKESKFGWYLGVGEWFTLTRRTRLTADLTMHRTSNQSQPVFVAFRAGLALSF